MINKNTYTNNHQLHIFINIDRQKAVANFLKNNISVNTSGALGDKLFLRIGVQEITKRGMRERDMKIIASFIFETLQGNKISNQVKKFNKEFSEIKYCFKI
jgi:glycine/serine hydroxymethyltransferase